MNLHSFIGFTALLLLTISKGISGATFTVTSKCGYTIWPGILSNAGSDRLDSTGFELQPGASRVFYVPPNWSGRLWGRTGCSLDPTTGQFVCVSGDCGSGQVECNGNGANPPATLVEFTVAAGGQDFYDVSLVDGFNLPAVIEAARGTGACLSTGCEVDLNQQCPAELRAGGGQACKSACEAFGTEEYCCRGEFGLPGTCKPSVYSEMFKSACPKSYSYAYDDPTSTFTCSGADYVITFCPASTSQKFPSTPTTSAGAGTSDGSRGGASDDFPMVYSGSWWLPDYDIGDSSKIASSSTLSLTLFLSISFLYSFFSFF